MRTTNRACNRTSKRQKLGRRDEERIFEDFCISPNQVQSSACGAVWTGLDNQQEIHSCHLSFRAVFILLSSNLHHQENHIIKRVTPLHPYQRSTTSRSASRTVVAVWGRCTFQHRIVSHFAAHRSRTRECAAPGRAAAC